MIFKEAKLAGVFTLSFEPFRDTRGYFVETWNQDLFLQKGITSEFRRTGNSFNAVSRTLRGMHFQKAPKEEAKLVRVTRGRAYDVVLDLRPRSKTFKHWEAFELAENDFKAVYVPAGCAHGFLTLDDNTEITYWLSNYYSAAHASGIRYDDPAFKIKWPAEPRVISEQDKTFPLFKI